MRISSIKRVSFWLGLQCGFLAVCSAQGVADSQNVLNVTEIASETLPKYRIEIIVFAYHDFDPVEERFEQAARGTLLNLLNPTLLQTDSRIEPDVSARLMELLLSLDEDRPALIPTETGVAAGQLEALPEQPLSVTPLGPDLITANHSQPSATRETDAQENFATEQFTAGPAEVRLRPSEESWYRLLGAEELELTDTYDRLERLDAYTPLVHGGWVQDGFPEDQALPFDLSLLGTFNPLGTIMLHVRRYLHVTVALRYQAERAVGEPLVPASIGLEEVSFPARYDLNTQRRTRSGELHFFDHPAFGVLVLVRPQPEAPRTAAEELAPAA